MSTKMPVPTLEVTSTPKPTPEPLTQEEAAEIYVNFLKGESPCYWTDGSAIHFPDLCWDRPGARADAIQGLTVRDLTGDGVPELCAAPHSLTSGGGEIWTVREGRVEYLDELNPSYESILPNGGIFYYRPGMAPLHNDYSYRWLSPESREVPEIWFSEYDGNQDGKMDTYYLEDEEVPREEWDAVTAPYFALWEAEPTEEQQSRPFLDWAVEVGADVSSLLPLEPWQAAYRDILLHPEKYEDIYALSEEDMSWLRERGVGRNDVYFFSLCDLDENAVPELLLGYGKQGEYSDFPRLLLNILHWSEETGTAEDMDGPRTYGLMDTLRFFENGYFCTMNGVSALYTVFWKLEDTPGHYWDGFLRPWMAGEEPKPENIVFTNSETGEKWSEDEFDVLTGMQTARPTFQELTEENVQTAFLSSAGEEEP